MCLVNPTFIAVGGNHEISATNDEFSVLLSHSGMRCSLRQTRPKITTQSAVAVEYIEKAAIN